MNEYILEAEHVCFSYENTEKPSLDDFSVKIKKGSRTAVMGANGSGKSTFFLCCNGILRPDRGQILFHGAPVSYKKKDLLALRSKVGIVFQNPDSQLFAASVYQEISFGALNIGMSPDEARREVDAVIQQLGITPFSDRPAHALSGGQKKQVALADILVMHPELLILDEPFASLDPLHCRILNTMIQDLGENPGLTVVTATHDPDFALNWADHVVLLKDGQVLAQGPPLTILSSRKLLEQTGLALPAVLRTFFNLVRAGMLDASLPLPRSFDTLEQYILKAGQKPRPKYE